MRPSRRLLWILLAALGVTLLAIAVPALPAEWTLFVWAAIFVAVVTDLAISRSARWLSIEADLPPEIFTGETAELTFRLIDTGRQPSFPRRPIIGRFAVPRGLSGPGDVVFEDNGETPFSATRLLARRRGTWKLEALWLMWPSRFGLIDFVPKFPLDLATAVVPNIRSINSGDIDLQIRSELFGEKQTAMRGEGSEFHQLSEFVFGMDTRMIDWKASARHRDLMAKEMRAERNHHIIIALDNGFLMREEIDGLPKIDHKINAALALAWAGVQGGDLVGLFAFDARPRHYMPPQPGRAAFAAIRSKVASLDYNSIETNHTLAMTTLHQRLNKRSLIVVFSDFVDTTTAELLVENVSVLNRHHVVVFVSLRDPLLAQVTGKVSADLNAVARSVSAAQMLEDRRTVMERLAKLGVYVIEADPGTVTPKLLSTYLSIKEREVI